MTNRYDWMERELTQRAEASLERVLRTAAPDPETGGRWLIVDGRRLLNVSSNNYLGLAGDPRLAAAAGQAARQWGAGAAASRLVVGNHPLYAELEERIARWKDREAALVYGSGYMANVGAITSLVGRGDAVFSDRLNHASIVDGIVLSRADHYRYRHNDMEHLAYLLEKYGGGRRKLIVTDAVFSMDGDAAPVEELVALKRRFGALLMVDEAHAAGLRGPTGAGLCHERGVHREVDVLMGTLSKAFGVSGAYVAGDRTLIRYLLQKSRSLIYTTGLPPAVIGAALEALTIVQTERARRERLSDHSRWFRARLKEAGFAVGEGDSPIVPLFIGDNETALRFSKGLEEAGIAAVAIRPPTVPEGTARIRFSLMATHTRDELAWAVEQVCRVGRELGVQSDGHGDGLAERLGHV